jgi:Protein of unknown function (DUF3224)
VNIAFLILLSVSFICGQASAPTPIALQENARVPQHASGTFEVRITPQKPDSEVAQAANLARMTIDKVFHGDLEANSKGEMIASQAEAKGSGGYVALERVTGTLNGRKGSFVLQHSGTMTRGIPSLSVTVVPDSGTAELKGLAGAMKIIIAPDGKHSYEFAFTIE